MKTNHFYIVLALLFLGTPNESWAQDYHFSQYDALVPTYQPALTGIFNETHYRGATQYRNQWRPLATKPFSTFALAYDMPVAERWGVGGYIVNYDGAKVFNAFNFVVSGAYRITEPTQEKQLLTVGLQMGMIYKNTNNSDLLFESQYADGQFNNQLPSNESFQRLSKLMPEFNVGAYYEWTDPAKEYHPYFGATVFHASSPKESILMEGEGSTLPRRYLFHTGCKLDLSDEFRMNVKGMYQYQGKASDIVAGLSGSYLLTDKQTALQLGCYYRVQDAVVILTGVTYEDLTFTFSYDMTTSGLKEFNGGRGAVEFTLVYAPGR